MSKNWSPAYMQWYDLKADLKWKYSAVFWGVFACKILLDKAHTAQPNVSHFTSINDRVKFTKAPKSYWADVWYAMPDTVEKAKKILSYC